MTDYVHGYTERESIRLEDQAKTLTSLLHHDSVWNEGSLILEAGCGIGSQTKIVAIQNPGCRFISVDISESSLEQAKAMANTMGLYNVIFRKADIFRLPFEDEYFDHIFICFVLEHLSGYALALAELTRVLKPNGTLMVIEGDHGSTYFHPDSREAHQAINCLVELQRDAGGDANIGRKLYPILEEAGLKQIKISPRLVYADESKPELVEGFTRNTFTAMIEGIRENVLKNGLMKEMEFDKGIDDLYRTSNKGGVFCYTFFKGVGVKKH